MFSKYYIMPMQLRSHDMKSEKGKRLYFKYLENYKHAQTTIKSYNKSIDHNDDSNNGEYCAYLDGFTKEIDCMLDFLRYDEKQLYKYSN